LFWKLPNFALEKRARGAKVSVEKKIDILDMDTIMLVIGLVEMLNFL